VSTNKSTWEPKINKVYTPDGHLVAQKIKRTLNGEWEDYYPQDDIGDRFAHRLAIMLECALLDPTGTWNDAHQLLDEYRQALRERDDALGIPYVSGFGKD
jgi:hypothetical protein